MDMEDLGVKHLIAGNEEKAIEEWGKLTQNKEVNSKNFSAFNNIGTYKLLSQDQDDIKGGIEAKIKLIESEYFGKFVESVTDNYFKVDNKKQLEKLVDELLEQFKDQYSSSETLELFSNCNGSTQKYLTEKFTEEPIYKIESQIESCKKNRKADKKNGYELGLSLFENTKKDLSFLKSLLGSNNLKYKAAADGLANEIMQSAIDYFNESQENGSTDDYLASAEKLTKIAKKVAVGKLATDKADDNLATLEEMKDREINQALQVMQSIKDAYDKNRQEIMEKIVDEGIPTDRIDFSKVTRVIEESIDWDKVTIMIKKAIPKSNIIKIKETKNTSKIAKFKNLVEFISIKVGYFNNKKISYLKYWQVEEEREKRPFEEIEPDDTTPSNRTHSSEKEEPLLQEQQVDSETTSTQPDSPSDKIKQTFWIVFFIAILLGIPIGAYVIWGWTGVIVTVVIFIWLFTNNK